MCLWLEITHVDYCPVWSILFHVIVMITMIKGAHFVVCVVTAIPVIITITMIIGVHFVVCVVTAIPVLVIKGVHFVMCAMAAIPVIIMITVIKGVHFVMCIMAAVPVIVVITMIKDVHFVMCVITAIPGEEQQADWRHCRTGARQTGVRRPHHSGCSHRHRCAWSVLPSLVELWDKYFRICVNWSFLVFYRLESAHTKNKISNRLDVTAVILLDGFWICFCF